MTELTATDLTATVDAYLAAWNEPDPATRAPLIEAVWAPDGVLVDPPLDGTGHDGISAVADALHAHYPDHRFRRTGDVDAHHDRFRFPWALVAADGTTAITGLDVGELAPDGRLARITGFFDAPT